MQGTDKITQSNLMLFNRNQNHSYFWVTCVLFQSLMLTDGKHLQNCDMAKWSSPLLSLTLIYDCHFM